MGVVLAKPQRRRLVDIETGETRAQRAKRLEFKPFGGWNYSYEETYQRNISFSIWAAVTAGSLAIDWREALLVLGLALWGQEAWRNDKWGSGASWVHNIQAGYCAYHYFVKNNTRALVTVATLGEIYADIFCKVEELDSGVPMYSHYAHIEGFTLGMASGFVLDQINHKKRALI